MHALNLGPADYPVLQRLVQTCTGIVYIQEVLYILHLSRVVLNRIPVNNVVDQTTSTVTVLS
jgi:hypothetical protein